MPASAKLHAKVKRRKLFEPLRFDLPETLGLEGAEVFNELQERLRLLGQGDGASPRQQACKQAMLARVLGGEPLASMFQKPGDIRAALALWRDTPEFLAKAPPDKAVLKAVRAVLPVPSRILLWQFIQLYLEQYDRLPAYRQVAGFIKSAFDKLPARAAESKEMQAYRTYCREIFAARDGPGALIRSAVKQGRGLPAIAKQWHLPETSRFCLAAKQRYYIDAVKKLRVGKDHPIFTEILTQEVKTSVFEDNLLVGHCVSKILMDKVLEAKADLPESWRHKIIGIMEDPRVPRSSPQFQTWWSRLDKKYVTAMRTWLSKLDLKLFLNILEEVARSHNKTDLLRMYPARKRFLEGLHELGLLDNSRLLLGGQAEKYIRENFDARDLPEFGRLGDSSISLIYLNLQGVHFLEGTHSFQARVYRDLPIEGLANYETRKFSLGSIRKYPADFILRHTHSSFPRWQRELIETLQDFHLKIDAKAVLSAEDYEKYANTFSRNSSQPLNRL
ncbi:MAG: hypothetical protein GY862_24430 [Gammaproteobacteria bacterium]|nr:hypothetical protein [Gammaproteobacteria bacterium]